MNEDFGCFDGNGNPIPDMIALMRRDDSRVLVPPTEDTDWCLGWE